MVVLPDPEGPNNEKNSPSWMSSVMSSIAGTSPKRLVSADKETAGDAAPVALLTRCSRFPGGLCRTSTLNPVSRSRDCMRPRLASV